MADVIVLSAGPQSDGLGRVGGARLNMRAGVKTSCIKPSSPLIRIPDKPYT